MRRIAGVILFVVGVLFIIVGITKIVPGGRSLLGTGAFALLIGLVVFGLSFIKQTELASGAEPPLSPAQKIAGIFFEPARIFQNLRVHPRWLAAFLVIALCSVIYQAAFTQRMTPEVITGAQIDKTVESGFIPADKAPQIREDAIETAKTPLAKISGPLNVVGGIFLVMLVFAGLYLLCVTALGGRMNFWQALAVTVYASLPVIVVQNLLSLVLLYVKSPDDINPIRAQQRGLVRADLGILFSPAEHPYLYTLGGTIGILTIYGLWLTATGLRNGGERVSTGTAWSATLVLWGLGVLLVLCLAALFPSFIS